MGAKDSSPVDMTGVRKILRLLDALRRTQTGSVIYRQVERMLEDVVEGHKTVERAYVLLIERLLDAWLRHLREGSPLKVQVRLLQARLQPPLTPSDLETLRDYIDLYASQIEATRALDTGLFQDALGPLLEAFGIREADRASGPCAGAGNEIAATDARETGPAVGAPVAAEESAASDESPGLPGVAGDSEAPGDVTGASTRGAEAEAALASGEDARAEPVSGPGAKEGRREASSTTPGSDPLPASEKSAAEGEEAQVAERARDTERQVESQYRSHLDSRRRDIQKLQATLAEQVRSTIAQNEEFGVLLEVVLGELRHAGDGKDLEDLRWTLIREIEKLTKGHHDLAEKLDNTFHYLQLIESDSRQLSDELTRVRLLSLTDELTGLPNRRAFLRRIEDEVARVQRYGFPLSLALIDLDHFKQVNDRFGHAGGDEVLKIYSRDILSIFRHHDLVARYGGEEFAVLLPNTDAEGSLRALTKVRKRALETRWQPDDELVAIPTFSAGVSLYKPGETASAFIERADKALYRAKRLGRNRVELDTSYGGGVSTETQHNPAARRKPGEA